MIKDDDFVILKSYDQYINGNLFTVHEFKMRSRYSNCGELYGPMLKTYYLDPNSHLNDDLDDTYLLQNENNSINNDCSSCSIIKDCIGSYNIKEYYDSLNDNEKIQFCCKQKRLYNNEE